MFFRKFFISLQILLRSSVLLIGILLPTSTIATIYQCHTNGELALQDTPCPTDVPQTEIDVVIKNDKKRNIGSNQYDQSQFSAWENELIDAGKVSVGMSTNALIQSWGSPVDINRSAYSPEQWVFRSGRYTYKYAYIRDGAVVNWQD
ncbi:conserved protein of unknown function [Shewanella benthica]|uniref:DUF4124 domain-containing protein n=1 Tax=Shewanella benthica TaxID=43661 RepID=A0A330M4T4_9GAMM|nr:DUF4124 domain-containing protein [Shewanella benthica]SQH76965.1 conserved protein of unknown function [Shewanella benthica]